MGERDRERETMNNERWMAYGSRKPEDVAVWCGVVWQ